MKNFRTYIIAAAIIVASNIAFAQTVVKQYTGGKKGVVMNASNAIGKDMSKHSTLNLKPEASESAYVFQNFVFSSESDKGTKVTFIVRTNEKCDLKVINMKLFTLMDNGTNTDTLSMNDVQVTLINEEHNLYEFSFNTNKKFDTAGIMICGGGNFQTVKIYKVYLAANTTAIAYKG